MAYTVDRTRAADPRGDRAPSRQAHSLHALSSARRSSGNAGVLATLLPAVAGLTLEQLDLALLELFPPLARLVPPATAIDKHVYSPFVERALLHHLRDIGADALVISGAETDVCVLAAVL
jgi:nicotinamidase-related amidase